MRFCDWYHRIYLLATAVTDGGGDDSHLQNDGKGTEKKSTFRISGVPVNDRNVRGRLVYFRR